MLIDFLIGFFLMNAMPHMVFGFTHVRFLSAFGYTGKANTGYAAIQTVVSLGLFLWKYGFEGFTEHGIFTGALTILVIYWITGRFFYQRFKEEG